MSFKKYIIFIFVLGLLSSCNHDFSHIGIHQEPRWEFAPNMYYSVPYEPLSQVTDSVNHPEYYNSNPYNPHGMTMREPVPGTISRHPKGILPMHMHPDSLEAAGLVPNPVPLTEVTLEEGRVLYQRFCSPCHGQTGEGDGAVGEVYGGVPLFASATLKDKPAGHIYHVITYGYNRMTSYATQLSPEERWKVVHFVHTLQQADQ
ncbi:cytochrome c [Cytophagaceae bacterium ABcell3]|nr:cytochrome c [Cytophagaceae bacterium ABcell3]